MKMIEKIYDWIANNFDIIGISTLLLVAFLGFTSCSRHQQDTIQKTEIKYIDSIVWHSDTIYVNLPNEKVTNVVPMLDTLYLETDIAKATAFVDTTTNTLKGSLENKNTKLPTEIKWKEKIVKKDSLVYVKEPYEVKVVEYKTPKWMKWYLFLTLLCASTLILIKTKKYWILFLKKFFVYLLKLFK